MNTQDKSFEQGNLRSHLHLRPAGSSVVQRFATRSITGRGLGLNVHQHVGFRLHLEWQEENNTRRYFERLFETFKGVDQFCDDMLDGGLEGLCDCVGDGFTILLEEKVKICRLKPTPQSQLDVQGCRQVVEKTTPRVGQTKVPV